jgi:hypothetical protein
MQEAIVLIAKGKHNILIFALKFWLNLCILRFYGTNWEIIMERIKLELTFSFECTKHDLFLALSKPNHLRNWIAPKVAFNEDTGTYTFGWGKSSDSAKIVEEEKDKFLKWEWVGGDRSAHEFVSFKIVSIPGDSMIDLQITDFCDANERKILTAGWEKQMARLENLLR